jgi:predicted nucleic-acid-binding protein
LIGLDTNVLARYFVKEEGADAATQDQRQAARGVIESG